jgi:AcrR family transcriptional regulator
MNTESSPHEPTPTRERLRQAAIELFGEKGYDGASMNELAERVGIAKPSLYNYYRSKEDLLLDVIDDGLERWLAECRAPEPSEVASYERFLRDHLVATIDFARRHPRAVAVFHLASMHVQGDLARRVQEVVWRHLGPFRAHCDRLLDRALAAGELPAQEAGAIRAFLSVFFQGLMFQQTVNPPDAERVVRHLDGVWRLLYRGLSGREPREGLPQTKTSETH